jgi:hypothetical protein
VLKENASAICEENEKKDEDEEVAEERNMKK